ncbi:hypothetical protein CH72_3950 [Burkholderia ambifaria AMMD]|uniref:Uncharacterized protein n=2 Tax=Burkholderia ambifaria TaxID=152480 RepID=Q0B8Q3_BURCM|nr:hypothetical protein [Burkholderia ambifaria]ABI89470.1 conserved hypothetical protein [Burkholderia ambifaria AMMD]AJY23734.1 hypothetical protein CH72_3950 [Burkholderia ambifaria AMMD]MBR7930013.1 hypothetical protein [Burkholderia ambifaria]PEH67600.1 hypothetical protein CRM91_06175 [Burkholderia ambifaria]QQC07863.1 hypothetical protein I6H84_20605 [Burkholderia ambifaria]
MTPERFRTIVAAYGSDARRWPQDERAAAEAWAQAHPRDALAALDDAAELDAWLIQDTVAPPAPALVERIVASAPAPQRARRRGKVWWSGAAFAGVGLAGALAGAVAVSMLMLGSAPIAQHEPGYLTTTFGGPSIDGGDE